MIAQIIRAVCLVLTSGGKADMPGGSPHGRGSAKLSGTVIAGRDQAFGKKYFLMLSPSVLNSTRVPRS